MHRNLSQQVVLFSLLRLSRRAQDRRGELFPDPRPLGKLRSALLNNLNLNEREYRSSIPGLGDEIRNTTAEGPFPVRNTGHPGHLQGRFEHGRVKAEERRQPRLVLTTRAAIHDERTQRPQDLSKEMFHICQVTKQPLS